jgi:branched-chain amino acid transport system ATP-binding protein
MLVLDNINTYYGESHVLHDVSLSVGEGEVVCLLGRNGAGKTTTILPCCCSTSHPKGSRR